MMIRHFISIMVAVQDGKLKQLLRYLLVWNESGRKYLHEAAALVDKGWQFQLWLTPLIFYPRASSSLGSKYYFVVVAVLVLLGMKVPQGNK